MKRSLAILVLSLVAFPATALADPGELRTSSPITSRVPDVAPDLRAPDQRTAPDVTPRLEATGTDVAAPDQQASKRSPVPVAVPAPAADGFDWADAGIGAAGAASLLALSLAGALAFRRGQAARPA